MRPTRLYVVRPFDPWKSRLCTCPMKWVTHPYTGCGHGCLYCYATSYIPRHHIVRMKSKYLDMLRMDLSKLPNGALVEISSSSDPYPSVESRYELTRTALRILLDKGFKVLIVTKSSLVVRDVDIFKKYKDKVVVSITITTIKDSVALSLEPGAPSPSERLKAIDVLRDGGINVVARIDPIVPYVNDEYNDLRVLVKELSKRGVKQITTSTYKARGDSLRRFLNSLPKVGRKIFDLYSGDRVETFHGYRYLNRDLRFYYMKMVKELAEEEGLVFSTCREGFSYLNTPGFACDGSSHFYVHDQ